MLNKKKLLIRIISLIFFIFFLNSIAMKFYWYSSIWWLDMPMHFFGGFWVGIVLIWFFKFNDLSFSLIFKILLCFLFIGVSWEVFEILVDKSITKNPFNVFDTLSDFCFGLSGTILSIFYFSKRIMFQDSIKV